MEEDIRVINYGKNGRNEENIKENYGDISQDIINI